MWSVFTFLRDERGSYTIWSLVWFSLYVAMGGLAVDMTDAYRNQTLLQSTADASALAGVMSLPNQDDGLAQALVYAADNMNPAINGNVLKDAEVIFGNWDSPTRTFTPGTTAPDAVRVITRRDDANGNPVATNFLRILGLWGLPMDRWNISVEAVATKYVPECLLHVNSLIAGNRVDVTSNNIFNNVCVHGQNMIEDPGRDYAVEIQNGGTIMDGVEISMPYLEDMVDRPTICSNDGLCEEGVLIAGDMMPTDAFLVDEAITGMLDPTATDTDYLPGDLYSVDAETSELVLPYYDYIDLSNCEACVLVPPKAEFDPITGEKLPPGSKTYEYTEVMEPGTVYVIGCSNPMDQLILPDPELQPVLLNVAVISECRIKGQSDMRLEGVLLASSAVGNGKKRYEKTNIHFPAGTRFGLQDNCAPGGGVRIYSGGSVHISAGASIDGMQIVARGDVELTANETIDGISIQAGQNIRLTANANLGTGCLGGVDGVFAWRYRLVL
jgi:hypothetical protein